MTAEEVLVKNEVFKTADKNESFNLIFHRDTYRKAQSNIYNAMIEFAQYHVEQALKTADEKSQVICGEDIIKDAYGELFWVDSESILNAYSKKNIT